MNATRGMPLGVSCSCLRWPHTGLVVILTSILCSTPLIAQSPADHSWTIVSTPDSSLRLQLPLTYRKRNDYGCWTREGRKYYGRGYRDLCVGMEQSEKISGLHLAGRFRNLSMNGACAADCTTYENVRVDTVSIAGRQVIAERGLASGGFEGMVRRRTLLLIIPFADGRPAVLHGETGDDAGYDELLSVARTVRESTTP